MQRVQLITDSGCDVLGGGFGGIDVRVIPFPYSLDGSERVDDPQYTPALDTFYEAIRRGARVTTSQVRVADCAQVFRNCANLNTPAVYITLSSGLSGTFEAALRARELVLAERPGAEIYVVDSLSAATGQALLVSEVARRLTDGCSAQQAAEWAEENRLRVQHLLTVDSLEHLVRGGRIPPTAAVAGSILDVKPIITLSAEGRLIPIRKTRGRTRALRAITELAGDALAGQHEPRLYIGHARCDGDALLLQRFIADVVSECRVTRTRIGLIIGAHTGPSAIMAAYWGHHRMN
ncbi:MAG: DegV family protein [Actinobacteria bacterium 66_15]|nr:MAG: DegV family protein [Actinobacteria bacterium 66_15]